MITPKISVVLPVYNGLPYLKSAVESVLNQNFKDYELLVCDDSSTDESYQYLLSLKNTSIKLFKNSKNKGLFPTLNFLIRNSKGELVQLWAQDDIMFPFALSETVKFFQDFPEAGFMFSRLQNIDKNNNIINTPEIYENKIITSVEHAIRSISYGSMPGNIANVVLNKKIVEKAGYFNEKMKYSGDFEMWCRLTKFAPVGECGKILMNVRSHSAQYSRNMEASVYKLKENRAVYKCLISEIPDSKKRQSEKILKWRHYPMFFSQFLSILFKGNYSLLRLYFFSMLKYDNFFLLFFRWIIVRVLRLIRKEHWFYGKLRSGFIKE